MLIKETFISIQGEGRNIGKLSLFIRMAGCNLSCDFCDTDFKGGDVVSINEMERLITGHLKNQFIKNIVITGGEPTIQVEIFSTLWKMREKFKQKKISIEIETNGFIGLKVIRDNMIDELFDLMTVNLSPKLSIMRYNKDVTEFNLLYTYDKIIIKLVVFSVDDLRKQLKEVTRVYGQMPRSNIWVQPIDMNPAVIKELIEESLLGCRLSIQAHKFIGVK
jgi:7-carboxy-7-deazaguanine synthase